MRRSVGIGLALTLLAVGTARRLCSSPHRVVQVDEQMTPTGINHDPDGDNDGMSITVAKS